MNTSSKQAVVGAAFPGLVAGKITMASTGESFAYNIRDLGAAEP